MSLPNKVLDYLNNEDYEKVIKTKEPNEVISKMPPIFQSLLLWLIDLVLPIIAEPRTKMDAYNLGLFLQIKNQQRKTY